VEPVHHFTTAPKTTTLISPSSGERQGKYYPSLLPFSWKKVDVAESYTIQISNDLAFTSLIFSEFNARKTEEVVSVKINANLWWRVLANAPGNDPAYSEDWSKELNLESTMPEVHIISPNSDKLTYQ